MENTSVCIYLYIYINIHDQEQFQTCPKCDWIVEKESESDDLQKQ